MNKAVFLDRDGTIIKDKGVLKREEDIEFYNYTFDSLRELQKNFTLFIITNQPGIEMGYVTEAEVNKINFTVVNKLKHKGIKIKDIFCCPHRKESRCKCRKPNTYFIDKAREEHSINIGASYVIGDHSSDIKLAVNAGMIGIYVLTGHGMKHYSKIRNEMNSKATICKNLKYAVDLISKGLHP